MLPLGPIGGSIATKENKLFFKFRSDTVHTITSGRLKGHRGALIVIHGRSRVAINSRVSAMPGRRTTIFSPTRQALLAPTAKRRDVLDCRKEGELHPTKPLVGRTPTPCTYFLAYIWLTLPNKLICFLVWPLRESACKKSVTASWVPDHVLTT